MLLEHIVVYSVLIYATFVFVVNLIYLRKKKLKFKGKFEKISVLVPVRDEERDLELCLESLVKQNYPLYEIILLDDNSRDRSPEIMREFQRRFPEKIKIITSKPLPPGWTGKNWACHQLAKMANGDWLLFTDADTVHAAGCIKNAYMEAVARGVDMVSYIPDLITISLPERIILPVIYFAFYLLFPLPLFKKIKDHRAAFAIGTFILIKRDIYERIGGHSALKDEIVEDVNLARRVKKVGGRFDLLDGIGIFYTRFYHNLREIWEGFTKNSFGAFGYNLIPYLLFLFMAYVVFLAPFIKFTLNPVFTFKNPLFMQIFWILLLRTLLAFKTRHSVWSIILHPLMVAFSLLFAINSVYRIIMGLPITWKGRAYKLKD